MPQRASDRAGGDFDREARDDADAALHEVERTGHHQLPLFLDAEGASRWLGVVA